MAAALSAFRPLLPDRRECPRVVGGAGAGLIRLRVLPGREASLVNFSRGGVCIEVASRLLPGTPVDLQVALPERRWCGRAKVLRCRVSALVPGEGVRYEAALQFDPPLGLGDPDGEFERAVGKALDG
jgi:hypothetical protein